MIDEKYFNRVPDKIITYGYPTDKNLDTPTIEQSITNYIDKYDEILLKPFPLCGRSKEEFQKDYRDMYLLAELTTLRKGFSGSPVFGEFNNSESKEVKFIGVFVAYYNDNNVVEIIKGSQVIKMPLLFKY